MTLWPWRMSALANALSRKHEPQIMVPEPAARMQMFKGSSLRLHCWRNHAHWRCNETSVEIVGPEGRGCSGQSNGTTGTRVQTKVDCTYFIW